MLLPKKPLWVVIGAAGDRRHTRYPMKTAIIINPFYGKRHGPWVCCLAERIEANLGVVLSLKTINGLRHGVELTRAAVEDGEDLHASLSGHRPGLDRAPADKKRTFTRGRGVASRRRGPLCSCSGRDFIGLKVHSMVFRPRSVP